MVEARLRRRDLLALMVVSLAAFVLRTYRLDGQSLWYDEGVTATVAARGLVELTHWTAGDIQPPLYYYLVAGWGQIAGWSEWSLRFPSVFFGVLTVPLLAAVAQRLIGQRAAARLAALLAACHPLLIYYSQEARMYALLVALGILAAYLLLLAADADQRRPHWAWLGYAVAGAAAAYTHYFAFFLLLGLSLAAAGALLHRRCGRGLLWLSVANGAILLLYLPWLNVMWQQLGGDRSYWTGDLKLGEALQAVAISFTSGATVVERTALWLLLGYGLITVAAVAALWRTPGPGRRTLWYGFWWLLAPVLAAVALAVAVPKFNPRYVMLALPGLLLLWAGGLGLLHTQADRGRWPRLAPALVTLLLLGFFYANVNWYHHPNFAKDDWRGLAAWLRPRIAADETIILVSGHAWPVWDYYAPDLPAVRLPALEILDVDAVLTFAETGPPLQQAFAEDTGIQGAWLINWQDEVVDPNTVVPVQLELGGREKGQSVTFAGIGLRRFDGIRAGRIAAAPPVEHRVEAGAGGQITLVGYKAVNNGDLLLFWQLPPGAAADDLRLALTTAQAGAVIAQPSDRRLGGYTYPTHRWQPGEIVASAVPAQAWLGATPQPGVYDVALRVYEAADPAAPLQWDDGGTALTIDGIEVIID
jgi:mannosyltransferase